MDTKKPSSSGEPRQLIKFEVHHGRHEGVSYEDMVQFARKEWLPLALPIFKRHGIVHYKMTFCDPQQRASLRESLQATGAPEGISVSDFDVVSTYYMHDSNAIQAVQQDPEWIDGPAKIQVPWVSLSPGLMIIGHEEEYYL